MHCFVMKMPTQHYKSTVSFCIFHLFLPSISTDLMQHKSSKSAKCLQIFLSVNLKSKTIRGAATTIQLQAFGASNFNKLLASFCR